MVFHVYDSRKTEGFGFPDLVIAGLQKTIFVELKSDWGTLSTKQACWKWRLLASGQQWYLWTPHDWDTGHVEHVLSEL